MKLEENGNKIRSVPDRLSHWPNEASPSCIQCFAGNATYPLSDLYLGWRSGGQISWSVQPLCTDLESRCPRNTGMMGWRSEVQRCVKDA